MSPPPVTIGIAVRFEAPDVLSRFVATLQQAARQLDTVAESEVIFCLNGALDGTREFLSAQVEALHHLDLPHRCIESAPGKIPAHREIAREREYRGHILFVDADLSFQPDTFVHLYQAMQAQPEARATYAEVEAGPGSGDHFLRQLQSRYYARRGLLPRRRHLHGRCFMLRDWHPGFEWEPQAAPEDNEGTRHLDLARGPLVDDIHYSRVLVHECGPHSIRLVPEAVVRFEPPHSWSELYRDSFRTEFELVRLSALFPTHDTAEAAVFSQPSPWEKALFALRKAGPGTAAYLAIEAGMRAHARRRIRLYRQCPKSWAQRGQNHHG
jgi:hypothetical protein